MALAKNWHSMDTPRSRSLIICYFSLAGKFLPMGAIEWDKGLEKGGCGTVG